MYKCVDASSGEDRIDFAVVINLYKISKLQSFTSMLKTHFVGNSGESRFGIYTQLHFYFLLHSLLFS